MLTSAALRQATLEAHSSCESLGLCNEIRISVAKNVFKASISYVATTTPVVMMSVAHQDGFAPFDTKLESASSLEDGTACSTASLKELARLSVGKVE